MNKNMKTTICLIAMIGTLAIFAMTFPTVKAASPQNTTTTGASVTVAETIDISVSGGPIDFGSLNSGTSNNSAINHLTISINSDTNKGTYIYQYASDLSDGSGHSITIDNLRYYNDSTLTSSQIMPSSKTSPTIVPWQNVAAGNSVGAYYWLSVPDATTAATYTTTINIVAASS